MQRIGFISGGESSWAALKLDAQVYGVETTTLVFADTRMEDEDTYRFLAESAANIGAPLVRIEDGRDIWQVFIDERMLGNTRADPCSKILKRKMCLTWLANNCDQANTVVVLGLHSQEIERWRRIEQRYADLGWATTAPLCQPPYFSAAEVRAWATNEGLKTQRLYELGFPHANCGGGCVKAGASHFRHLLLTLPERYREWEEGEERVRASLGKDVSILRDRRGGRTRPLTLNVLRERIEKRESVPLFEWGGCGCFAGDEQEG